MSERICLVVDNEPAVRTLLGTIMRYRNLQAIEAENAVRALTIVQELCGHLDLIVTEINTPGEMDGLDLACSVRTAFPSIPVILISAYNENAAGFDLIPKPFLPEAILKAVDRAIALGPERAFHAAGCQ